jgi:LacI family transcriptional regulator
VTATIRDVAQRAGVSIATVSRVMNDHPDVGLDTRRRVLDAAGVLGYVAHGPARALATSQSQLVGVVLPVGVGRPEIMLTFFGEVIDSIARHLDEHGYDAVLLHNAPLHGHTSAERAARHRVDGLLFLGAFQETPGLPATLPCVGIDAHCAGPNRGAVVFDNADGIRLVVGHLYALGHRRIAYLGGPASIRPASDRLEAFRAETDRLAVAPPSDHVREGDWSAESGYRETCAMLAGAERPTAIVAAADVAAIGAMQAIRDYGLEPGRDVAVTGFDDLPAASLAHPTLTTIRQDRERLGAFAVTSLFELLETPGEEGPQISLPVSLVVRASSGGRLAGNAG